MSGRPFSALSLTSFAKASGLGTSTNDAVSGLPLRENRRLAHAGLRTDTITRCSASRPSKLAHRTFPSLGRYRFGVGGFPRT
jgi:ribosomal protein L32